MFIVWCVRGQCDGDQGCMKEGRTKASLVSLATSRFKSYDSGRQAYWTQAELRISFERTWWDRLVRSEQSFRHHIQFLWSGISLHNWTIEKMLWRVVASWSEKGRVCCLVVVVFMLQRSTARTAVQKMPLLSSNIHAYARKVNIAVLFCCGNGF